MKWFGGNEIELKSYSGEQLAEKIAEDMYFIDREEIFDYPEFIQNAFFLIDFDAELTIEGIFTVLENSIGQFMSEIIKAFRAIGDETDAEVLDKISKIVSVQELREELSDMDLEEYQITSFDECHDLDEESIEKIEALSKQLYLHSNLDIWELLFAYLDREIHEV